MRIFIYILMALAIFLLIFNLSKVDYSNPLGPDSIVAVITSIAAGCALLVLAILRTSQQIKNKSRGK